MATGEGCFLAVVFINLDVPVTEASIQNFKDAGFFILVMHSSMQGGA